jgi:hypothetical protein
MQHIIRKQMIELILDRKPPDIFGLQHAVSKHYWERIIPMMEKAFDEVAGEDKVIEIDELEIDLGAMSINDIEEGRWVEFVFKELSVQLALVKTGKISSKKIIIQPKPLSISGQWLFYMEHGYLPWNVLVVDERWYKNVLEAFASDSEAINKLRQLIRENQDAPARMIFQHDQNFIISLLETLTSENQNELPKAIDEMAEVIGFLNQGKENNAALQNRQLIQIIWLEVLQLAAAGPEKQTPAKLAESILTPYLKELTSIKKLPGKYLSADRITATALKPFQESLLEKEESSDTETGGKKMEDTGIPKNKLADEFQESVKEISTEDFTEKKDAEIGSEITGVDEFDVPPGDVKPDITENKDDKGNNADKKKPSGETVSESSGQMQEPLPEEEMKRERTASPEKRNSEITNEAGIIKDMPPEGLAIPSEDIATQPRKENIANDEFKTTDIIKVDEEGIFIQHAGIVLLHPFLNMFFEKLQLIREKNFIDLVSHQKALYLLHYLATGNTEAWEHELVMAKVLCAYALQKPVDNNIGLTADELKEADHLLNVVIKKWEILKGTSPAGLRQEFLQRNGKLYEMNNDLHIQVETKSIDVLISHLPWNLEWIKLPWMKSILRVKWG